MDKVGVKTELAENWTDEEFLPRRENMAFMIVRLSRISQILLAVAVAVGLILVEVVAYGPDIDGRTPSRRDTIEIAAIEAAIVLAFAVSAIALFRWHKLGWWSSAVLDGLLGLAAASMIVGDFNDRYMASEAGRSAFRGDLVVHGAMLLLSAGTTGLLVLARRHFLPPNAN